MNTGGDSSAGPRAALRSEYLFFVSYAHTPSAGGDAYEDADFWVGEFFRDLSKAVAKRAGRPQNRIGFIDREMKAGSNWADNVADALAEAEIFVPLYAPRYFASGATGREWTAFSTRLRRAGVSEPNERYVPVLWIPLPPAYPLPKSARWPVQLDLVAGYRENGLQAMCRLPRFRSSYETVISSLADRIVRIALSHRIGRSEAPRVTDDELEFPRGLVDPKFVIAVAAAQAQSAPPGHYGFSAVDWRPFGLREQLQPLSAYAATIAERFQFSPVVTELSQAAEPLATAPGIVLIDPWLGHEQRAEVLRTVRSLPPWTLPLVVVARDDPRLGEDDAHRIADLTRALAEIRPGRTEAVRRAADGIRSLAEFDALFPILVTDAARRYLLEAEVYPPPGSSSPLRPRPSISDSGKYSDE